MTEFRISLFPELDMRNADFVTGGIHAMIFLFVIVELQLVTKFSYEETALYLVP